jgi:hypothetical protein
LLFWRCITSVCCRLHALFPTLKLLLRMSLSGLAGDSRVHPFRFLLYLLRTIPLRPSAGCSILPPFVLLVDRFCTLVSPFLTLLAPKPWLIEFPAGLTPSEIPRRSILGRLFTPCLSIPPRPVSFSVTFGPALYLFLFMMTPLPVVLPIFPVFLAQSPVSDSGVSPFFPLPICRGSISRKSLLKRKAITGGGRFF